MFLLVALLVASPVAVKAARLFDATAGRIVQPGLVVVDGDRIAQVGGLAPPGAQVIDLGDATLLPGLIDAHRISRRRRARAGTATPWKGSCARRRSRPSMPLSTRAARSMQASPPCAISARGSSSIWACATPSRAGRFPGRG